MYSPLLVRFAAQMCPIVASFAPSSHNIVDDRNFMNCCNFIKLEDKFGGAGQN
jgi:hypothetical protein